MLFMVLAALPARAIINVNANQDTFVISNEAPGFLIAKLINAGHGGTQFTKRRCTWPACPAPALSLRRLSSMHWRPAPLVPRYSPPL